jgi:hypothetical protein
MAAGRVLLLMFTILEFVAAAGNKKQSLLYFPWCLTASPRGLFVHPLASAGGDGSIGAPKRSLAEVSMVLGPTANLFEPAGTDAVPAQAVAIHTPGSTITLLPGVHQGHTSLSGADVKIRASAIGAVTMDGMSANTLTVIHVSVFFRECFLVIGHVRASCAMMSVMSSCTE